MGAARQQRNVPVLGRRPLAEKGAAPDMPPDPPLGFHHGQGAAKGAAADSQHATEVALGRQPGVFGKICLSEPIAQRAQRIAVPVVRIHGETNITLVLTNQNFILGKSSFYGRAILKFDSNHEMVISGPGSDQKPCDL